MTRPILQEGVGVVVCDPDTSAVTPDLAHADGGLCWDGFTAKLVEAYVVRFED